MELSAKLRAVERLVRFRWPAAGLLLLALLALGPGMERAAIPDNALTVWFLESDPNLLSYQRFQQTFGNDEVLLIHVVADDALAAPVLDRVAQATEVIEAVDGVNRVHSVLSVRDAWKQDGALTFGPALARPPPAGARERLLGNPLFVDRLISADGTQLMLWVEMVATADFDARRDSIVAAVAEAADGVFDQPALGGIGVIYSGLNVITQHDFGLFVGLGYLLIFGVMGWLYRSWRLVFAAMGVVAVGTSAALGIYGWLGHQLNMVTVVLPTLIIVLGLADVVHFPASYVQVRREHPGLDRSVAVARALGRVFMPCLLTTVTTMAGFLALASSPMAVIRHLGIFSAIGVAAALLASLVLMAIALHSLPAGWRLTEHRRSRALLDGIRGLLVRHPRRMTAAMAAIALLAGAAALRVEADTYTLGYLPDDHRVVLDHASMEASWGPYSVLDFLVHPAEGRSLEDHELLAAQERFLTRATELPDVVSGTGLPNLYRRMASVLGVEVQGPLSRELVAQLSLLLEVQGLEWDREAEGFSDNVLAPLRSEDASLGRLTLTGAMMSAKDVDALLQRLHGIADEELGALGSLRAAGYPPLYTRIVDYAMTSQIRGFFLALAIIFVLMLLWLRSPRLAAISLVPNIFPVLVMLGVMGALDIRLDIATATVAAIVVGVSIDDTVHFLLQWRLAELDGLSWEDSLARTFEHAGIPAVTTTLLLVVGYPVLMLAEVKTVVAFGLLTTVAAAAALLADLVLLPLLLRWRR